MCGGPCWGSQCVGEHVALCCARKQVHSCVQLLEAAFTNAVGLLLACMQWPAGKPCPTAPPLTPPLSMPTAPAGRPWRQPASRGQGGRLGAAQPAQSRWRRWRRGRDDAEAAGREQVRAGAARGESGRDGEGLRSLGLRGLFVPGCCAGWGSCGWTLLLSGRTPHPTAIPCPPHGHPKPPSSLPYPLRLPPLAACACPT